MKLNIALLAGDGIGPEVIDQAVKVSNAIAKKFNHEIVWTSALTGAAAMIHRITHPRDERDVQTTRLPESKQRGSLHFDRQHIFLRPV